MEDHIFIMTDKYSKDYRYYGIDGQYFKIPLNKELKHGDVITTGNTKISPVYITDEPIEHIIEREGSTYCEYWLHTVKLYDANKTRFFPKDYLLTGTFFYKLEAYYG